MMRTILAFFLILNLLLNSAICDNTGIVIDKFSAEQLNVFSKLVFITDNAGEPQTAVATSKPPSYLLVYNNDAFAFEMKRFNETAVKQRAAIAHGKPLELDAKTPIGYNIYLPEAASLFGMDEIKAVLVSVYGGGKKPESTDDFDLPGELRNLEARMLDHGIAVVTLNLVDLRQYRDQWELTERTHNRLHASINKFFEQITKNPEGLHPDLAKLKGKKFFLLGQSFGGRTAVMQAERYPGTYSGYISQNGSLADRMDKEYLRPVSTDPCFDSKIAKITDPVLLLQNLDDNRVSAKQAFLWYQRALLSGKDGLVKLHVTKTGSPLNIQRPTMKGHFLRETDKGFDHNLNIILDFVLQGVESVPSPSEWAINKSLMTLALANPKHFRIHEIFLAAAYRYFKDEMKGTEGSRWSSVVQTLSHVFLGPQYADFSDANIGEKYPLEISQSDFDILKPLLFGISYLSKPAKDPVAAIAHLKRTLDTDPDRSKTLESGLKLLLPSYITFLSEMGFAVDDLSIDDLSRNPELQQKYYDLMTNPRPKTTGAICRRNVVTPQTYAQLLLSLFRGNIEKIPDFLGTAAYQQQEQLWAGRLTLLRNAFNKILMRRAESKSW